MSTGDLSDRVVTAAEHVLAVKGFVSPIELLQQIQLLAPSHVRLWEKGLCDFLEPHIQGSPKKLTQTYDMFSEWARENRLVPVTATLHSSGREQPHELQVTTNSNPARERFFRTYYAPADITARKLESLKAKLNKAPDLVVFMTVSDSATCQECSSEIGKGKFLFSEQGKSLCLRCADLDHLEFLPSGDAALSRRARKHSPLSAVVVQFNRQAKRYERRGILVTAAGRQLHEDAIRLAVIAHIRHAHTRYDQLLMRGCAREEARRHIAPDIEVMLARWQSGSPAHRANQAPPEIRDGS